MENKLKAVGVMCRRKRERGIAIIVTLMVLTIIMVIVFAVGAQGIWNLNYITNDKNEKMAFYAAEAGINENLLMYKKNEAGWQSGIESLANPRTLDNGARYYTQVTWDPTRSATLTAPNGVSVKPNMIYFLGTGMYQQTGSLQYRVVKRVGVMVDAGDNNTFTYAIASAGDIDIKNSNINGNIKVDGDLKFNNGNVDVNPVNGQGKVLCGGTIDNTTHQLNFHPAVASDAHDCKARINCTGPGKVNNASPYSVPDASNDTLPFICDGTTTPTKAAGQQGQKLPNPNMQTLLSGATVHNETTCNANLGTGVHYFPNGVTFGGNITSNNVTIIAGKLGSPGNITFNSNVGSTYIVNIIAVDGGTGADWQGNGMAPTNASITFPNSCTLKGLVYCQGSINAQGQYTDIGSVITYKAGSNMLCPNAQSSYSFNNDYIKNTPGFEAWFSSAGATTGTVTILSWQRM
jgi:Tfp pilus assembly protein PilX